MNTLTRLPQALWVRQSVAEDAFMPRTSETMHHVPRLVQNHTLDLIFVFSSTVARLQRIRVINTSTLTDIITCVCIKPTVTTHLIEGHFAGADVTVQVSDHYVAVVLEPPLLTEDVVDAGHCFIPLIMISVSVTSTEELTVKHTHITFIPI